MSTNLDLVQALNTELARRTPLSPAATEQLSKLSQSIGTMADETPEGQAKIRKGLAMLSETIHEHGAAQTVESVQKDLAVLRNQLALSGAALYSTQTGDLSAEGVVKAGVRGYTALEEQLLPANTPEPVRVAIRGAAGLTAGAAVLGTAYLVATKILKPIYNGVAATLGWIRDTVGGITATVISAGALVGSGVAAFNWLPEPQKKAIAEFFASSGLQTWLHQNLIPQLGGSVPSEDQIKAAMQNRETQQKATDDAISLVDPTSASVTIAAQFALKQIQSEIWLIESLPEDRRKQEPLAKRMSLLNTERERMTKMIPQDALKKIEADRKIYEDPVKREQQVKLQAGITNTAFEAAQKTPYTEETSAPAVEAIAKLDQELQLIRALPQNRQSSFAQRITRMNEMRMGLGQEIMGLPTETLLTLDSVTYRLKVDRTGMITVNDRRWKLQGFGAIASLATFTFNGARRVGNVITASINGRVNALITNIDVTKVPVFRESDMRLILPHLASNTGNYNIPTVMTDGYDLKLVLQP